MRIETRLHRARVERGIDLSDLAARTRLSPRVVKTIDEGRFAELPPGVYARSYVRAFASEVGVDPREAVQDLQAVLPAIEDPLDGLREAIRRSDSAYQHWINLAARAAAAALDAGLLLLLDTLLVLAVAATCGVGVPTLLHRSGAALPVFCAIPVLLYFLLFGGIGGRTPGTWLCHLPPAPAAAPLRLEIIFRRMFS